MREHLIDFGFLILSLCAPAIAGFVCFVLLRIGKKFGYDATEKDKQNMNSEMVTALKFAIEKEQSIIKEHGINSPEAKFSLLTTANEYVQQRFQDRTAKIAQAAGATGDSAKTDQAVKDSLSARLKEVTSDNVQNPMVVVPALPVNPSIIKEIKVVTS